MNSALVVGDQGSGLTTFVGLLYTAQVRLGTEESDEFRFHADRETIRQLEAIYGELGAGRFPERDVDWEEHPLTFAFGFRNGGFRSLAGHGSETPGDFGVVRVQVGGISTQELAELREHDAVLARPTRLLLRSQVVIPLVDASRLRKYVTGSLATPLAKYDHELAATFDLLARFLSAERSRKARRMHPLFVVTKLDQLPAATLAGWGAPPGPASGWPTEAREKVGGVILERFLPETAQFLSEAHHRGRSQIELPVWYFSELRLVENGGTPQIARRSRLPYGGWEPEYPFEEYRSMIGHLARLGQKLPRASEE